MSPQEAFRWRGVNFWAHIKNWYEVHSLEDNQALAKDMASMGFNDLWITFERGLVFNYTDEEIADHHAREFWRKLCGLGTYAKQLGMRVTVLDEFNTVFLDQYTDPVKSQYIAEGPKTFKSLKRPWQFCPSKPEAWEIILRNHEWSFKNFPVIDALVLWPYDNGGCGCDQCDPYPKTFFELSKILAKRLRIYHPGADVYLSTWDMTDEEKGILTGLLAGDPGRTFQGIVDKEWMLVDIEEESPVDYWTKIGLPADYLRIPYIDLCQIGRWGWQSFTANPYPARFEKLLAALRKAGITQYGAYSEDVHDDINKFLLARLGISSKRTASQLIDEYCMQYFRAGVGREVYKVACMMEEERTNKFKSPWVQQVIWDKEKAHEMLAILQEMEDRLPTYVVEGWRWQVLIKRAEISWLLNNIGQMDDFKTSMRKLMDDVASCVRVEEAKDIIQKASLLIEGKRKLIETLKNLIEDFRNEVLQEPMDRGVNIHGAFESISGSYFAWQKMLLEYEETFYISGRGGMIKRIQKAFKEGLENVKGEFEG